MSIDIDWDALTSGPEGAELAESVRAFIHDKFQQVPLPRFICSVQVHSFEFGDVPPKVVLKDLSDPLPEFYEDGDDDEEDENADSGNLPAPRAAPTAKASDLPPSSQSVMDRRDVGRQLSINPAGDRQDESVRPPLSRLQSKISLADHLASPLLSRSGTPGIPGGTSNLSYFHLPLAGRMQGGVSPNPMSAVRGWQEQQALYRSHMPSPRAESYASPPLTTASKSGFDPPSADSFSIPDPSTRPSTAHSQGPRRPDGTQNLRGLTSARAPSETAEPDPNDLQIILHISYNGNVRLSLTAEILLDYPMPSFVGIPFKLNITGLDFDGVALLAFLNIAGSGSAENEEADRRAHFCFLSPEDAETLVGAENTLDQEDEHDHSASGAVAQQAAGANESGERLGGLLRGIRVESEIGKTKDGKQNLKNLGKVEKFILEQVRQIFEDEFVFPSFWTFLV